MSIFVQANPTGFFLLDFAVSSFFLWDKMSNQGVICVLLLVFQMSLIFVFEISEMELQRKSNVP